MLRTQTRIVAWLSFALFLLAPEVSASLDKLRVVTTIPDLADITREVGGDAVSVKSIARGNESVHAVPVRPSALIAVNKADLFIQVGLGLEHAFAPGLVQGSRNPKIQPGEPGFLSVSEGWQAIQIPQDMSRQNGVDIHPLGNPHINLDPASGEFFADRILKALCKLRPAQTEAFEARHADYVARVREAQKRWKEGYAKLADVGVVTFHQSFDYYLMSAGMVLVATLEPLPGVPPTPGDLKRTIEVIRRRDAKMVLTAKWSNNRATRYVGKHAGVPVVELPVMAGGAVGADTWIEMQDLLLRKLTEAAGAR